MDQQMTELNQKLDMLTAQVAYLTEQAQAAERAREERTELMHSMMPIANDVMRIATEQLQDVEEYMDPRDLLRVVKKLVRALPFIETMLDQVDGIQDLLEIAMPMTNGIYNKVEGVLDTADKKGYFRFAHGGMQIMDNIVTSFTEDEVRRLGDNIVLILRTVQQMTQPDVMNFLSNTITIAEKEVEAPVDTSIRSLLAQLRDPNVRRGLALSMRMLSTVGAQATTTDKQ